jgi:hypothetical protein
MTVYEKVVSVTKTYMGPATEAFLSRQCKSHLKKEAADLATADLANLAKWMEVGAGLLMDPAKATELAKKVRAL